MENHVSRLLAISTVVWTSLYGSPVDQHVTPETMALYNSMLKLSRSPDKVMFGHHEDTLTGISPGNPNYQVTKYAHAWKPFWKFTTSQADRGDEDELSDIRSVTGEYPAIVGFDFKNFNADEMKVLTYLVKKAHTRGQVITVCQHNNNPVSGGSFRLSWDNGTVIHTLRRSLPGGDAHTRYKANLDKIASWANTLKDANGKSIPIIYRLFHEMDGDWFWWGINNRCHNTPKDVRDILRYTVSYLRDVKGVHNFLYNFAIDCFSKTDNFHLLYPGDDFIDIIAVDYYYKFTPTTTKKALKTNLANLVDIAESRGKIPAIAEAGMFDDGIFNHTNFWTDNFLTVMKTDPKLRRILYILGWHNICWSNDICEYWVPFKGFSGASQFRDTFYKDPVMVFEKEVHALNVYG
ncbi:mannan endo-1,4-beta-mannosidase-like [Haliotis cracherodii]|uniref:mannan endo-1,4-beta-mannosidase-like n=1 Tax=Haliotis cracherodii TaxID=6455 RepID=UPI0039EB5867